MFLSKLFAKKNILLKAKLDYNNFPNFKISEEGIDMTSMEYFTLSLLVYSRILRYSKKETHIGLHSVFNEINDFHKKGLFKIDSLNYINYKKIFTTYYTSKYSSINLELKKNIKENFYYLYTSTPHTKEVQSFVYITFFYVFEKMQNNEENLISAFIKLGEINLEKPLTLREATIIPNELENIYFSVLKYVESMKSENTKI